MESLRTVFVDLYKMTDKSVLQGCLTNISHQSNLMKQCLENNNLLQALKHCSNFLNELRVNQLSPKQYYEIYIAVFDNLDRLCNHLTVSFKAKHIKDSDTPFLSDLYELVQYSGNIIPRLYMMIAVGTTFISTGAAPTEAIMKDMIEMCRGVQSPIRGLFLRYYLSQKIKDHLPMANQDQFNDTVEFLINNFVEMNKLWVRLQHQGHSSERELRYQERKELKILVGANLVTLSQIIDDFQDNDQNNYNLLQFYETKIFPTITEQIIQCKDHLAQVYLIDVIIQIFPVMFHFQTLNLLLNKVIINLNPTVNKAELIVTLIERFINYNDDEINLQDFASPQDFIGLKKSLFGEFWAFYQKLQLSKISLNEQSTILMNLVKLTSNLEQTNYDNLNIIYKFLSQIKIDVPPPNGDEIDKETQGDYEKLWLNLLIIPIQTFESVTNLVKLSFFNIFFNKITNAAYRNQICLEILNKLLNYQEIPISQTEDIDDIFKYLVILINQTNEKSIKQVIGITKGFNVDKEFISNDFLNNQNNIAKILSKLNANSGNILGKVSNLIYIKKKYLSKNSASVIYTYPTLIQLILNNLRLWGSLRKSSKLVSNFKNLSIIIDELYELHGDYYSDQVMNLYLNVAQVTDELNLANLTVELFNKIFIIYEEKLILGQGSSANLINTTTVAHNSLNHNSIQYQTILVMVNKLASLRNVPAPEYQELITKVTLYGSKLLKKQDQCRAVFNCSHLFYWTETAPYQESNDVFKDEKRVMECLQKALRVADSCIDPYLSIKLFIEILSKCLQFDNYGSPFITSSYVNRLIELIKTNLDNLVDDNNLKDEDDKEYKLFYSIRGFFQRNLDYIEQQKEEGRFVDVVI